MGHLQKKGFQVKSVNVSSSALHAIKDRHGVPARLRTCHTGVLENYVIEGHVPASVISRMMKEKPPVAGIGVPGMPTGSPGMEVPNPVPYDIFTFDREGRTEVYAHIRP